jgi:hypothetical protein
MTGQTIPFMWPDLTSVYQIAATTSDGSITLAIPNAAAAGLGKTPNDVGNWYFLSIVGNPVYLNIGAAATSANAYFPVGCTPVPWRFPSGAVIHALTATGTATVSFIRARIST